MKENYNNLPWFKSDTVERRYPLTEDEKVELADIMAEARVEIERLNKELADIKAGFKSKIDMCQGQLADAAFKCNSGLGDPVLVDCDVYRDFDKDEAVYVTKNSGEELFRRPLTDKEKGPDLFNMLGEGSKVINFPKKSA